MDNMAVGIDDGIGKIEMDIRREIGRVVRRGWGWSKRRAPSQAIKTN